MSNGNHIPVYTAADIEKYRQGQLTPAQMHAMEKAALEDPFLSDAMEGYEVAGPSMQADLADLRFRLQQNEQQGRLVPLAPAAKRSYTWLKVAAMAVIVFGAAFLVYRIGFTDSASGIALQDEPATNVPVNTADNSVKLEDSIQASAKQGTLTLTPGADQATTDQGFTAGKGAGKASPAKTAGQGEQEDRSEEFFAAKRPPVLTGKTGGIEVTPSQSETRAAAPVTSRPTNEEIAARKDQYNYEEKEKAKRLLTNAGARPGRNDTMNDGVIAYARGNRAQYNANTFRGKVLDAYNNALPFVNITNSQDNIGTYTDARGNFVLTSPDSTLDVRVKSLGFESQAVELRPNAAVAENKIVLSEADNLSAVVISRQKVNSGRARSSTTILESAEPVDGWRNYDTYLANNLNIPEADKGRPTQTGEVELSFEVDKKGEPVNITVVRSLCESCDREAIRLLKEGPKWKRKARQGRTSVTIPF
ncbi:MAG: hypothetical protein EOO05_09485 [Chitinophagaceae bacterium]|nr:MAG: hypothetical protein EOO05_09485 [Chitinophagaceae bacterium]